MTAEQPLRAVSPTSGKAKLVETGFKQERCRVILDVKIGNQRFDPNDIKAKCRKEAKLPPERLSNDGSANFGKNADNSIPSQQPPPPSLYSPVPLLAVLGW